jgi:hypothetical protein
MLEICSLAALNCLPRGSANVTIPYVLETLHPLILTLLELVYVYDASCQTPRDFVAYPKQILISYLMQTAIALLSFFTLAILAFLRSREKTDSENPKQTAAPQEEAEPKGHYAIVNAVVAEFHKSQCYFAMALQIATFVIIRGDFGSTTWSDKNFLLLVSADGLVPVVLTLYTIMAFGTKSWYIIVLTVITVILSSITGGLTSRRFLQPTTFVDIASGGNWPATCGGIGPVGICNFGLDPGIASGALLVAIGVLDTITIVLVLWKVFTQSTNSWSTVTKWLPVHRTSATTGATDHPAGFKKAIQFVRRHPFKVLLHSLATSALLALVGLELYEFDQIFNDGSVDLTGWGFGQIVGITIWISVFTELGYLEFS